MSTERQQAPAYVSFKSFNTFFNDRRDDGHVTTVVDRSLMSNFSGSTANELLAALKFLKLISESGEPQPTYENYVMGDDSARVGLLSEMLKTAYPFVFEAASFNLERGTTAQMAELFRSQGVSGSTLSRAVSFFLAAAKQAGIKVSQNIKAPALPKNGSPSRKKEAPTLAVANPILQSSAGNAKEDAMTMSSNGVQHFEIPIPINRKVRITIPAEWSAADWDLFQTMLNAYIAGWKSLASKPKEQAQSPDADLV